ncbi:hypothetical protein [Qipengyuania spongiae]|uniref:DUF3617 family protein n=1 Tax=Qipengyuania spongiae TaxID=2909673 RepID=A0ABY5SXS1_9SPHN|nr:hypothetical protein [Qipengyuania spongiae]UVI38960.1 hypothetical protein L1F33_12055 [Qipengyuania spongiae]
MRLAVLLPVAMLGACGSQPAADAQSAEDFAARVGTSGSVTEGATAAPAEAQVANAAGDARQLQRLGDVGKVDLGISDGNCTFSAGGEQLLVAAAPDEPTLPGKAAVQVAGRMQVLDAQPGGLDEVRGGTTFRGEGFSAKLTRAGGSDARLTITDQQGDNRTIAGKWACT